ncbi:MAG: DUF433 domain-containing protein [Ignavibacteria bacterium]|jgi:uncharacterized protein (DUF433 family)|nr:DUF433 domain-containing protein [Ignavibacteria bacterium]
MEQLSPYISINYDIRFGKPCIKGTRIAVGDILQWLADGKTKDEIMLDFPLIKKEHISAALGFAAKREYISMVVSV